MDYDQAAKDYLEDRDRPFPTCYISFPITKDSGWNEHYPRKVTIDIITMLPYETFAQWEGKQWMHGGGI